MQWPVKARGCQHLSFLNHDIGKQILAVYPERGARGLPAEAHGSLGYPLQSGLCFVVEQAGIVER